jgi:hypothetical protein
LSRLLITGVNLSLRPSSAAVHSSRVPDLGRHVAGELHVNKNVAWRLAVQGEIFDLERTINGLDTSGCALSAASAP